VSGHERRPTLFQQAYRRDQGQLAEVVTDKAATYPVVLDERLPAARHRTEQYATNGVE
jgi:hypothetical protein